MTTKLHLTAGSAAGGRYELDLTPEQAGWTYSGLRVLALPAGGTHRYATGEDEVVVLPLSGGCPVEADRPVDVLAEVRSGDVVLVPHGWHGPAMAVPGYDLYYLNVMAGPGPARAWLISDDPAHAWVRGTWTEQPVDPRLPMTAEMTGAERTGRHDA